VCVAADDTSLTYVGELVLGGAGFVLGRVDTCAIKDGERGLVLGESILRAHRMWAELHQMSESRK
jgi:hypothetical protein